MYVDFVCCLLVELIFSSHGFYRISLDLLHKRSCMMWKQTVLLLPFQSGRSLFLFHALLIWTRISRGKSGHFCFVFLILRGKLLDFTIKYDISTGFLYMPFIKLRNFPSIPSFHCFYHEICWILSNVFFVSIEMILVFVCYFFDVVHYIN